MEAVRENESSDSSFTLANWISLLTLSLLGIGLLLRLRGYAFAVVPLWEDEAAWALRLVDLPVTAHDIRPLGFMAVSKLIVSLAKPSEAALRALPWLAGLAALAMAPYLARRLFSSAAARLIFIAVIALHPAAIDLSKEFKPYSVGLALHMGLLLLALRYLDAAKTRDLTLLLALSFVGTLFSQDALFTYPGVFALLLYTTYRARRWQRLGAVALTALTTVGLLATLYFAFWSKATGERETTYWGKKYDVFYVKTEPEAASRLGWITQRSFDVAALPSMRHDAWKSRRLPASVLEELKQVDTSVWQVLCVLGAASLVYRRRARDCVLLLSPLAVLVAFNAFGFWPLGAFRTNLFLLLYVAAIAAAAFDRAGAEPRGWDVVPACALLLVPFLLLGNSRHSTKWAMTKDSAFTSALDALSAMQSGYEGSSQLALDSANCPVFRYYQHYHPSKRRQRQLRKHFNAHCAKSLSAINRVLREGLTKPDARAFALLGRGHVIDDFEPRLPKDLQIDAQTLLGDRDQLVVRVKRR